MLSEGTDRSVGCRKCMKRAMQVLSEVPKPLTRFLRTCQSLCADFTFSVTWVCLEAAVNHQNITGYPGMTGRRSQGSRSPTADVSYYHVEALVLEWFLMGCLFLLWKEKVAWVLHTNNCSWKIRNCSSQSSGFIAVVNFLLFLIGYDPSTSELASCSKETVSCCKPLWLLVHEHTLMTRVQSSKATLELV